MAPLVSVVIPTHNRDTVLRRAIDSVLAQTHPECETIVVDDASVFDVAKYLEDAYAEILGDKLKVVTSKTHLGAAEARNIGAASAAGEFVAFLDSDDWWLPAKLAKQVEVFRANPSVGVVCCDVVEVDRRGRRVRSSRRLFDENIWEHLLEGWMTFPNTSSLVLRRKVFLALGGFDGELTSCQDHDLWMRIGLSGIAVRYVAEQLYVVTTDAGNNRISSDYGRRMRGVHAFLRKWRTHVLSRGRRHFRRFKQQYLVIAAFDIFASLLRKGDIRNAARIYRENFILNPSFYWRLTNRIMSLVFWRVFARSERRLPPSSPARAIPL